jgi:hypothetical protein
MSITYGWEKFQAAVTRLAGDGAQRQRLVDAVVGSLIHITPVNDLPSELQAEFMQFMSSVTSMDSKGFERNVQATVDRLSDSEVRSAVGRVISIYDSICRLLPAEVE